jgi:hypothetical protein
MVLWECLGSGYGGESALLNLSALRPVLGPYLSAGGTLWVGGRQTVAATTPAANRIRADFVYPKTLDAGNFCYDYLKLHSPLIDNDGGADRRNTLVSTLPADPEIYPHMTLDPGKLHPTQAGRSGQGHADAVMDPIFAEQEPGFRGDVDSLYYYGAAGPILEGRGSTYHNRLCAVRWHDPDPDRRHGRTQWFSFSLYYMYGTTAEYEEDVPPEDRIEGVAGAQETFNRSMDWFREEFTGMPGP